MLSTVLVSLLATTLLLVRVDGFPVVTPLSTASTFHSIMHPKETSFSHHGSSSTTGIEKATARPFNTARRTPTPLERKVAYKPRTASRLHTGTPREQVSQMRYRIIPKKVNESEEEYQLRKEVKEKGLIKQKNWHLNKIIALEAQYSSNPEEVTKQYNEWMRNRLDRNNFYRTKEALSDKDMAKKDYDMLRKHKDVEHRKLDEATKLRRQDRINSQRKLKIVQALKSGDDSRAAMAMERMEKYGITDLNDGHKIGARKTAIRKMLAKDPGNLAARQEALDLGMNPDIQPAPEKRPLREEGSSQQKRLKTASAAERLPSTVDNAKVSSSREPTESVKKTLLPFDLNLEPPIDEE